MGQYPVRRGSQFFVPLNFVHKKMKLSIRPNSDYDWAPLLDAFEETSMYANAASSMPNVTNGMSQLFQKKVCVCSKLTGSQQKRGRDDRWKSEWDGRSDPTRASFPHSSDSDSAQPYRPSGVFSPFLDWCCEFEITVEEHQNSKTLNGDSIFGRKASVFEAAKAPMCVTEGNNTISVQIFPPLLLQNLLAQPMAYSVCTPCRGKEDKVNKVFTNRSCSFIACQFSVLCAVLSSTLSHTEVSVLFYYNEGYARGSRRHPARRKQSPATSSRLESETLPSNKDNRI